MRTEAVHGRRELLRLGVISDTEGLGDAHAGVDEKTGGDKPGQNIAQRLLGRGAEPIIVELLVAPTTYRFLPC